MPSWKYLSKVTLKAVRSLALVSNDDFGGSTDAMTVLRCLQDLTLVGGFCNHRSGDFERGDYALDIQPEPVQAMEEADILRMSAYSEA